jgi:hypothetical protein
MWRHVLPAAPGIVFLSGGRSVTEVTLHPLPINRLDTAPQELSFSNGRARQQHSSKYESKPGHVDSMPDSPSSPFKQEPQVVQRHQEMSKPAWASLSDTSQNEYKLE